MSAQAAALLTTKSLRECQDIVDAAIEQGWDLQKAGHHLKLVPPPGSGGVPVGLSGSPSNIYWRHQIIRQLRRSGLEWPWPPHGGGKKLLRAARNQEKKKKSREPLQVVPDNQEETPMTAVLEAPVATNGHAKTKDWQPVLIEGVVEGYEVNEDAVIIPPKTPKFHNRAPLVPLPSKVPRVNLKTTGGKYKAFRVDEIVLEAFVVRPGESWMPEHIDGDETNCKLANLRWAESQPVDPAYVEATVEKFKPGQPSMRDLLDSVQVDVPVFERETGEEVTVVVDEDLESADEPATEAKPRRRRRAKKAASKKATPRGIQRFRSYKLGNITITVGPDGHADLSKARRLTPADVADLAALATDVAQSNKFFGIE